MFFNKIVMVWQTSVDLIELLIVKQDGGGSGQGEGSSCSSIWWWWQWARGEAMIEEGDGISRVHYRNGCIGIPY